MPAFSYFDRCMVPQLPKEVALDRISVLQNCLPLFVTSHDHEISKWNNPVLDQELLIVVLFCSAHLELKLFSLLLRFLFLSELVKLRLSFCLFFVGYFLQSFFLFSCLLSQLGILLGFSLLFIALFEKLSFLLPLLCSFFHHDYLSGLFRYFDQLACSLFLSFHTTATLQSVGLCCRRRLPLIISNLCLSCCHICQIKIIVLNTD